jgi:hypothetical protein
MTFMLKIYIKVSIPWNYDCMTLLKIQPLITKPSQCEMWVPGVIASIQYGYIRQIITWSSMKNLCAYELKMQMHSETIIRTEL